MIVAEYRAPLLAACSSTVATFTGTGGFCTCLDWQATSRASGKRVPPTTHALNPSKDFNGIPRSFLLPQRFFQFSFSGPERQQCLLILIVCICKRSLRLQYFRKQSSLESVPALSDSK